MSDESYTSKPSWTTLKKLDPRLGDLEAEGEAAKEMGYGDTAWYGLGPWRGRAIKQRAALLVGLERHRKGLFDEKEEGLLLSSKSYEVAVMNLSAACGV